MLCYAICAFCVELRLPHTGSSNNRISGTTSQFTLHADPLRIGTVSIIHRNILLHTKYRSAVHQAAIGSAHMVCSDKTLKVLLRDASQIPLPAHADFTKVLADSCSRKGPCPSIVVGNDLHFRNIYTAAVKSLLTVTTLLQQKLDCGCCAQCKFFFFFFFFGRERYSLHECNDNNLKEM